MQAIKIAHTLNMRKEDWLKHRKIGGSTVGAILGISPFTSPYEAWGRLVGLLPPAEDNMAMRVGRELEDFAARLYAEQTGYRVQRFNYVLQHPANEFATANVDRLIYTKDKGIGILECKTAGDYANSEWAGGNIPPHYMAQLQWYFYITGYKWGAFAAIVGNTKFYTYEVTRNDEMIAALVQKAVHFWVNHVIPCVPPEVDASSSCTGALASLYSDPVTASEAEFNPILLQWVAEYNRASAAEKVAKEQKDLAGNHIKQLMGNTEIAKVNGQRVATWKLGKKGRTLRVDNLEG